MLYGYVTEKKKGIKVVVGKGRRCTPDGYVHTEP